MPTAECVIWVDRHVHKNAGTTVREVMQALHAAGWLQRLGGYGSPLERWLALTRSLATLRQPCAPSVAATRIAIEAHEKTGSWAGEWLPALRRLRAVGGASCCRVLLTTRLREPFDAYLSLYRWADIARRFRGHENASFLRWAPPNLQATQLLRGDFRGFAEGNIWSGRRIYAAFSADDFTTVRSAIRTDFDLVYPTERFDAGLTQIGRALGLPRAARAALAPLGARRASPTRGGTGAGLWRGRRRY